MFRQFLLNTQNVLRSINAEVGLWGVEHLDFKTVLQCSQLFQRFRALERGGLEPGEGAKHTSLVTVESDVSLGPRERRTREIQGVPVERRHDFHDIARPQLLFAL